MKLNLPKPTEPGVDQPIGMQVPVDLPPNDTDGHPSTTTERFIVTLAHITQDAKSAWPGLLKLFGALLTVFLSFFALADYTSFTTGQMRPGELVFSNTMVQLWTASYRLVFIDLIVLLILWMTAPALWALVRPDHNHKYDLTTSILNDLTPKERIWLFFIVFYANAYLFVLLLTAKLPESISAGP